MYVLETSSCIVPTAFTTVIHTSFHIIMQSGINNVTRTSYESFMNELFPFLLTHFTLTIHERPHLVSAIIRYFKTADIVLVSIM